MTKQEFLAMSLPYDVKVIDKFDCIWTIHPYKDALDKLSDNEHLSYENFIKEEGHRLILRPLSDLTTEIEHKGERFVPINRIKESQYHLFFRGDITSPLEGLQFSEIRKLIEWHFDLFGGIENKEAINVNDLKTNPYK